MYETGSEVGGSSVRSYYDVTKVRECRNVRRERRIGRAKRVVVHESDELILLERVRRLRAPLVHAQLDVA